LCSEPRKRFDRSGVNTTLDKIRVTRAVFLNPSLPWLFTQ
jgi:hypothetical protein